MSSTTTMNIITAVFSLFFLTVTHSAPAGEFPTFEASMGDWPSQWNSTCRDKVTVPAECAELSAGFEFKDDGDGITYFHSPETDPAHSYCTPDGVSQYGEPTCGQAVFRFYCHDDAIITFSSEGMATDAGGNDDSVWLWVDGYKVVYFYGGWSDQGWTIGRAPGNGYHVSKGAHALVMSEREDGTKFKSVAFLSGFPICHFGYPDPVRSAPDELQKQINQLSTSVGQSINDLEVQTNENTDGVADVVTTAVSVADQLTAQVTKNNNLDRQIVDLTDALSTQKTNFENKLANLQTTVDKLTAFVGNKVTNFAVTRSQAAQAQSSIETDGANIMIRATQGSVKVSDAICSNMDLCEMGKQIEAITSKLNQRL